MTVRGCLLANEAKPQTRRHYVGRLGNSTRSAPQQIEWTAARWTNPSVGARFKMRRAPSQPSADRSTLRDLSLPSRIIDAAKTALLVRADRPGLRDWPLMAERPSVVIPASETGCFWPRLELPDRANYTEFKQLLEWPEDCSLKRMRSSAVRLLPLAILVLGSLQWAMAQSHGYGFAGVTMGEKSLESALRYGLGGAFAIVPRLTIGGEAGGFQRNGTGAGFRQSRSSLSTARRNWIRSVCHGRHHRSSYWRRDRTVRQLRRGVQPLVSPAGRPPA